MGQSSVYVDIQDQKKIEEELKNEFIWSILVEELQLPLEEVWKEGQELTVEDKIKLRTILAQFSVDVISNGRGAQIFFENNKIAEWFPPFVILQKKASARKTNALYYELKLKWWSLYEKGEI